jgi:uncharacterized membrane protein
MRAMDLDLATKLGRLHPMALHFPIACLLLAAVFEWVALARRGPRYGPATRGLVIAGAAGAVLAVLTGLRFAEETTFEDERGPLFERHRIAGFVAAGAAVLAVVAGEIERRRPARAVRAVYLLLVHVAAVSVAIGAHAGGLLHWGSEFLDKK